MTLFLVSAIAFLAFEIIPGDVVTSILGTEATPEREAQLREELGLNNPPLVRYFNWVTGVLQGDFGVSYRFSKNMNEMMPVAELIGDKLPVTLWLAALSLILILVVSIPLGVIWAKSNSKVLDAALGVITQATMAIPAFFLGILVTYLFGILLKVFQPGAYVSYEKDFGAFLGYLLFPALSIALPKIAIIASATINFSDFISSSLQIHCYPIKRTVAFFLVDFYDIINERLPSNPNLEIFA